MREPSIPEALLEASFPMVRDGFDRAEVVAFFAGLSQMRPADEVSAAELTSHVFSTARRGFNPDLVRARIREIVQMTNPPADGAADRGDGVADAPRSDDQEVADTGTDGSGQTAPAHSSNVGRPDDIGSQVNAILESARATAATIRKRAADEAAEIRANADRFREETELRLQDTRRSLAEADAARQQVDADIAERRADAERYVTEQQRYADDLVANARDEVAGMLDEARTDADRTRREAHEAAEILKAEASARATQLVAAAEEESEAIAVAAAERARERSADVLADAQTRLDQILSTERDVHDRLAATIDDLQITIERVSGRKEELDLTTADVVSDPADETAWADDVVDEAPAADQLDLGDVIRRALTATSGDNAGP